MTHTFDEPLDLAKIADDGRQVQITADSAQLNSITERLELDSLTSLNANLLITRDGATDNPTTGVFIEGTLRARGTQICVVSLQPVEFAIDAEFSGLALPADSPEFERDELTLEEDEVDLLGEVNEGRVDLGEIVIQQLALELDPFPRAEGAEPEWNGDPEDEAETEVESPFAALAKLKETLK